ncbi:hypothetical protein [Mucilaginibacter psychrotolerans]|uniref:Transposase n=1 Tax=Mucilaginibacter psychrotolerans TaxID=1524096 RepID=A0A4Y8S878_9SPHI|nr:hypothetical protein [Mucilaginibacter psychrotolerans]TFF34687.1 hypothetical protein E2R66_21535 [Mucilaginibacter psychrotolerans]
MKKLFAAALLSLLFAACTDPKQQEKTLLDEVIAVHDSVMVKDELVTKAKMQLDTLAKKDSALNADTAAKNLVKVLDNAVTKMEDWMHKFDAENKGKSHEQIMTYLADQKKQIKDIDKQFDAAIEATNNYKKSLIKK